jgi:hypothetical protein
MFSTSVNIIMADQYTPEEIRAIFEEYNNAVKSGTPITAEMTARMKDASAGIKNYTAQLNASLKSLGSSVAGFVGAMKDGKQGAAAYNDSINAFANAIDSFLSRFGFLGKMLGTVLTAGARYTAEVNKQSDALFDAYKNLSQSGLSDAGGMRNIFDNMQKFGYGIEQLGEMTALLKENSKELAAFGGTAATGTKAFADAAGDIQRSEIGKSLQMLGKTPDDINKGMAMFIKNQQTYGVSSANINQNLAQKSAEYVKNLDLLSKLTGESAEGLNAKLEDAKAEDAFAATQYELKKKALAGDLAADRQYKKNEELAQRLEGEARKEFIRGAGGDISAFNKTLLTAPGAVQAFLDPMKTADQALTTFGKEVKKNMDQTSGLAMLNASNDAYLGFAEQAKAASRYADQTAEQQKDRAKAEQDLQQKGLEPGTKAQVELRIEQMKTRDSLQSMINKGIVPVTQAMQKLAGATETVVSLAPGTTPTTGAQIGGGTSPGVVSGKSVTIGGQTRSGGDRNWRNNNPGNIEYGPFAIKYGAIGSDGRFAIFPTEEQGRMAQDALLKSKNYANLSLSDAIKRYAPSNENDPKSYANQIMKATGIDTSKSYASLTPEEQGKVLDAMKKIEGGRAGTVSGPNSGYQSKTSGLNPSASLPTATSSNAPATNAESDTPSWLMSLNENLERQNRLQSEAVDALGRIRQNTAV